MLLLHVEGLLLVFLLHLLLLRLAVVPLSRLLVLPGLLLHELLVFLVLPVYQLLLFVPVSFVELAIAGVWRSHLVRLDLGRVRWRSMIRCSCFPCLDDTLPAEVSWTSRRSNRWLALVL